MTDKKLWKVFSEYIRRRYADDSGYCKCITCGVVKHWKEMDAGHGIGRQHWGVRYNERNVHPQCKKCNGFDGGRMDAYKEAVNKMYGSQTWDLMLLASKKASKMSQSEIDLLEKYYKQKIKEFPITQLKR